MADQPWKAYFTSSRTGLGVSRHLTLESLNSIKDSRLGEIKAYATWREAKGAGSKPSSLTTKSRAIAEIAINEGITPLEVMLELCAV